MHLNSENIKIIAVNIYGEELIKKLEELTKETAGKSEK